MLKTIPYYFYQVDAIESWLDEQAQKGVTVPSSAPTTLPPGKASFSFKKTVPPRPMQKPARMA